MYRLHIDIPLGNDEETAVYKSNLLIKEFLEDNVNFSGEHILTEKYGITQANYRLGHDDDRQKSNYLDKNENGHVSNKKIRLTISG